MGTQGGNGDGIAMRTMLIKDPQAEARVAEEQVMLKVELRARKQENRKILPAGIVRMDKMLEKAEMVAKEKKTVEAETAEIIKMVVTARIAKEKIKAQTEIAKEKIKAQTEILEKLQ